MSGIALTLFLMLQHAGAPAQGANPDLEVEQLSRPQAPDRDIAVPNVAPPRNGNPAQVSQLPSTLDAPRESGKGEATLVKGDDRRDLAGEVARAAEMLRQRGQQPTPEALAREIGPDALAAYLNQDPSALDVYSAPREPQGAPVPDDGGSTGPVIILPGPQGG
ncbi:hypothetical protein [Sphingobium sp.]|uniref:hypothetical protein n=1 Tax=Sphingobium sp. TaxID=1912891 RepID=UPI0028BF2489|nr:hypothetical protein [Sphingobium sp.]